MDTKRFARFTRPGHAVTGDRYRTSREKKARIGWEFCHSVIDDHSRLAYSELHRDERADTVTGFLERAFQLLIVSALRSCETANSIRQSERNTAPPKCVDDIRLDPWISLDVVKHLHVFRLRERFALRKRDDRECQDQGN